MKIQLLNNLSSMKFNCFGRDIQHRRHFFRAVTFGNELNISAGICFDRTRRLAWDHTHPEIDIWDERLIFGEADSHLCLAYLVPF